MRDLYKVGDKVTIVKPPPDQLARCWLSWARSMDSYVGKQTEISFVSESHETYRVRGCDRWLWHESWLIPDSNDNLLCGDLESLL